MLMTQTTKKKEISLPTHLIRHHPWISHRCQRHLCSTRVSYMERIYGTSIGMKNKRTNDPWAFQLRTSSGNCTSQRNQSQHHGSLLFDSSIDRDTTTRVLDKLTVIPYPVVDTWRFRHVTSRNSATLEDLDLGLAAWKFCVCLCPLTSFHE